MPIWQRLMPDVSGEDRNMFIGVNHEVLSIWRTRMFADGYTSVSVWRVKARHSLMMNRLSLSGLRKGAILVKIADDLSEYLVGGKAKLMKRYGRLEAGTKQFAKRIPKNVDYRAMRLASQPELCTLKEVY